MWDLDVTSSNDDLIKQTASFYHFSSNFSPPRTTGLCLGIHIALVKSNNGPSLLVLVHWPISEKSLQSYPSISWIPMPWKDGLVLACVPPNSHRSCFHSQDYEGFDCWLRIRCHLLTQLRNCHYYPFSYNLVWTWRSHGTVWGSVQEL